MQVDEPVRIQVVVSEDGTDASMFQAGLIAALEHCLDGYWKYTVTATSHPEIENRVLVMDFTEPVDPEGTPHLIVRVIDSYQAEVEARG